MTALGTNHQWRQPPDDDELVRRLRGLQWPEVSLELRSRCWEEFAVRLAEQRASLNPRAHGDRSLSEPSFGDRYAFSRRLADTSLRPVTGSRMAIAASSLSRPGAGRRVRAA